MSIVRDNTGYTLVELLVAMAVFSFMLLIVVVGFMNVVRLHDMAVATNIVQDNTRVAMDEMVRAVRDSSGLSTAPVAGPNGKMCLNYTVGGRVGYWTTTRNVNGINVRSLFRNNNCAFVPGSPGTPITDGSVTVVNFDPKQKTSGAKLVKPEIEMTITVTRSNSTATTVGGVTACNNNNQDRAFCSVMTLTSGATPR